MIADNEKVIALQLYEVVLFFVGTGCENNVVQRGSIHHKGKETRTQTLIQRNLSGDGAVQFRRATEVQGCLTLSPFKRDVMDEPV